MFILIGTSSSGKTFLSKNTYKNIIKIILKQTLQKI